MEIDQLLEQLAAARYLVEEARAAMKEMVENVQQSDAYLASESARKLGEDEIARITSEICDLALNSFADTGEKHPHEKVEVKVFKVVSPYDEKKAREWCLTDFRPALKLDKTTFEKAVKDGNIPAELAYFVDDIRVQIASKL
jgi:hypothetical protein